jgi:uncharacterized radical SAM superfamily protein
VRRFRLLKNIRKGIEGAILSGGAVGTAVEVMQRSGETDITEVEQAITILVAAVIGFAIKSFKNWLKNRDRHRG